MDLNWAQAAPTVLASFLASAVEFVEALTVVLAVGSTRGWRSALAGSAVALMVLLVLVVLLGTTLARVPLDALQLVVGALLTLFGLRWLRKAILRAAGVIPLHDEAAAFAKQAEAMRASGPGGPTQTDDPSVWTRRPTSFEAVHRVISNGRRTFRLSRSTGGAWDRVALATTFQITMLEGIEVVFIVVAIGAGGSGLLTAASVGALAALLVVVALGAALHRPLASVPENALKFVVGVLLAAFGTFWVGEGVGLSWPGADWSIPALVVGYLATALAAVALCRARAATPALRSTDGGRP